MTNRPAVLTFAVHLASRPSGRICAAKRGANLPGCGQSWSCRAFLLAFFSTAICNLLLVHVLLGVILLVRGLRRLLFYV